MNPIERALERADRIVAANRHLEALSTQPRPAQPKPATDPQEPTR